MTSNIYGVTTLWAQGDFVIRGIAMLLLVMSIASWYVIVSRAWRLMKLRRCAQTASKFWHAQSFGEGLHIIEGDYHGNPFRLLAEEGKAAVDHHASNQSDLHGQLRLTDWLAACLRGAIDESAERMQGGLSVLASVGSTAPFVGLFGTVWGIYHALVSIGAAGQASIGEIAGPVGEALIMTALGLAVAIPAVIGYNALVRGNKALLGRLHRFAHQLHAYFITGAPLARNAKRPAAKVVAAVAGGN
ncbi:MAG: biopolymer transport protein ExbB [Gammaproteobacteria bacterium]|nr:MAG: biopolymer transport protein ExbB [Gammaproteobacteria bacterium]TND02672.1 MAG: biopolymer transport protein ExbB [Gammaproteobacteria bacterium]